MADRQKLQIVVEAVDSASKDLKKISSQVKVLSKDVNKSATSFGDLTKTVALGSAVYDLTSRAIFALGRQMKTFFSESLETKLGVERLSASLPVLAANAGKTQEDINALIFAIRSENKSMKEAMEITQGVILAELEHADALKLLSTARNVGAAVGKSSAEVNKAILLSLKTLNPGMLGQVGLSVSLRIAYDKMAKSLGKAKSELTATERRQAIFNEAMLEGERFQGAYDAAMKTTTKVLSSVKDSFEDVKFVVGGLLDEALFPMVRQTLDAIRTFRAWAFTNENELNPQIKALSHSIGKVLYAVWLAMIDIVKEVGENFKSLGRLFDENADTADWLARNIHNLGKQIVVIIASIRLIIDWFIMWGRAIWNLGNIIFDFTKSTGDEFNNWGAKLMKIIEGVLAIAKGNFAEAALAIKDVVFTGFTSMGERSKKFLDDLLGDSQATADSWENLWGELVEFMDKETYTPLAEKSKESSDKALAEIQATMAGASEAITETASKASEEVSKIMQTLTDKSDKVKQSIVKSVEKITEKISNLNDRLRETIEKNTQDMLARRTEFATAFVSQEEKVAEIQRQIGAETDAVKRSILEEELAREKAALESVQTLEQAHNNNIIEARRRARLTDFERFVEDFKLKRAKEEEEFAAKKRDIEMEIQQNENKRLAITQMATEMHRQLIAFANARVAHTEASVNTEIAKWEEMGRKIAKITAQKYRSLETIRRIDEQIAQQSAAKAEAFAINIPRLAKGGIVTQPTLAVVGEAGTEAVVPLNGEFGKGANVTVNVSGNTIMGGGVDDIAKEIGDIIYDKLNNQLRI